jgi:hypothetical protein
MDEESIGTALEIRKNFVSFAKFFKAHPTQREHRLGTLHGLSASLPLGLTQSCDAFIFSSGSPLQNGILVDVIGYYLPMKIVENRQPTNFSVVLCRIRK